MVAVQWKKNIVFFVQ